MPKSSTATVAPSLRSAAIALASGLYTKDSLLATYETMRKRCSKDDRLQRLKENGGTPACEEAVLKGLRWLKTNQSPDGSWGKPPVGMTGLVLLAYFGHCETPASDEFGDSCLKGIVYLVDMAMKNNGKIASNSNPSIRCIEGRV